MEVNNLKVVVVDDEDLALRLMLALLQKQPGLEIVGQASSGYEAVKVISDTSPDVVFLDIEMPGLNGFEVVKALQADTIPLIVFTTAFDKYALEAFDIHAVDYILKPLDVAHVERALERVRERLSAQVNQETDNKSILLGAIHSLEGAPEIHSDQFKNSASTTDPKKIVIKDRDEIFILRQEDIQWVDAAGDYVCIHSDGKTYIKRSTMRELEEELVSPPFQRVHRSTIVNVSFIQKVIPHAKGEFFVVLDDDIKIKVSRNYRQVVKSFLDDPTS